MPEPANREFVEHVRHELREARLRALEVLGKAGRAPVRRDPGEREVTDANGKVLSRRKRGRVPSRVIWQRRQAVLWGLIAGDTFEQIAVKLGVSAHTVSLDVQQLRVDYHARNTYHLVALATFDLGFEIVFGRPFPSGRRNGEV